MIYYPKRDYVGVSTQALAVATQGPVQRIAK